MSSHLIQDIISRMGIRKGFSKFLNMEICKGLYFIENITKFHALTNILYVLRRERLSQIKFLANRNFTEVFPIGQKIYLR